jgi:hypothetical protein
VRGLGFSIPRVSAAAESSSAEFEAVISNGTYRHSTVIAGFLRNPRTEGVYFHQQSCGKDWSGFWYFRNQHN